MEQLPVEHRGGPRQPKAGRGLRGRDARLRGAHHQGPQGRPLRLQQLLQAHIQGQFSKLVDEFVCAVFKLAQYGRCELAFSMAQSALCHLCTVQ